MSVGCELRREKRKATNRKSAPNTSRNLITSQKTKVSGLLRRVKSFLFRVDRRRSREKLSEVRGSQVRDANSLTAITNQLLLLVRIIRSGTTTPGHLIKPILSNPSLRLFAQTQINNCPRCTNWRSQQILQPDRRHHAQEQQVLEQIGVARSLVQTIDRDVWVRLRELSGKVLRKHYGHQFGVAIVAEAVVAFWGRDGRVRDVVDAVMAAEAAITMRTLGAFLTRGNSRWVSR